MKMKVTLSGLRVALGKVCLFILATTSTAIPVMFFENTGPSFQNRAFIVIGLGVMIGVIGSAYFALVVAFWLITPRDKNAPLPYGAEEWAHTHSLDERKVQLNKEAIRFFVMATITMLLFVASLPLYSTKLPAALLLGMVSGVKSVIVIELINRYSAREAAHKRLVKAEKIQAA